MQQEGSGPHHQELPAWEAIRGSRGFSWSLTCLLSVCQALSGLKTEVNWRKLGGAFIPGIY